MHPSAFEGQPVFRASRVRLFVLIAVTALLPSRWWTSAGIPGVTYAQAAGPQATAPQTYEGILNVVWGDARRGSGVAGQVRFTLALPDGSTLPLLLTGQENAALAYFGKAVVVTGRPAARPVTTTTGPPDGSGIIVSSIGPAQPAAQAAAGDISPSIGTQRILFLLLQFADDAEAPHLASFYLRITNPDAGSPGIPATLNGVFKKMSNNRFAWIGEVGGVGGLGGSEWIALPQPKSYYADCDSSFACLDFGRITADSVAAGKAQGIDFADYDTISFVYSNDLDCCAWGGSATIDGKVFGVTWQPPWAQETDTYAHELGHSLGLPHSGWVYFDYDSPWDLMSGDQPVNPTLCGSYFARGGGFTTLTCSEPGAGFIMPYRDYLGWISAASVVRTDTFSNVTVTLDGASLPRGANPQMIKICLPPLPCSGSDARYFTVEARVKGGGANTRFDNGIPGEGVIIHDVQMNRPAISGDCFFSNQSGWAVPVDATPGDYDATWCVPFPYDRIYPNYALYNAQFRPGQTYINSTYGFRVSVGARTGSSFQVSVQSMVPTEMSLDSPANGSTVTQPFTVGGWAINRQATTGTGVDAVHVWAAPADGGAAVFLGAATYGDTRGDIASLYGAHFTSSGFSLSAGASLAPGRYTLTAYAHNAITGVFDATRSANITIAAPVSNGFLFIDTPAPSSTLTSAFEVGGWALDAGAPTGTGVDSVQFYVFPNDGAAPGVYVGTGSYGGSRPDVAGMFGSRFTNVGFHFTITGLGPGSFLLGAYAHSTVTGGFTLVKTLHFTVNADALMSIDVPSAEATITAPAFDVSGWAIDRAVEGTALPGTGVDTLHVYAYPNPGSGEPAIFLGVADTGLARSDLGGIYGSRFTDSGYVLNVDRTATGLTPGVYNIVVWAHSTATSSFNNLAIVRVTLQ